MKEMWFPLGTNNHILLEGRFLHIRRHQSNYLFRVRSRINFFAILNNNNNNNNIFPKTFFQNFLY